MGVLLRVNSMAAAWLTCAWLASGASVILGMTTAEAMAEQLLDAAKNGRHGKVKELLAKGANVNSTDEYGYTALHLASRQGHTQVVAPLIGNGAELDARDMFGYTPLMWAAEEGHLDLVRLLLEKGAKHDARDSLGGSPLMSNSTYMSNYMFNYGTTPLMLAALHGHLDLVRLLLAEGVDATLKDNYGKTARDLAVDNYNTGVVAAFDVAVAAKAAGYASVEEHEAAEISFLLPKAAEKAAKQAAEQAGYASVEEHEASKAMSDRLINAAKNGRHGKVKELLAKGANVNSTDEYGYTALHWACYNGHRPAAASLIGNGAELDPRDNGGRTPLMLAALHGHLDLVCLLLAEGEDATLKDKGGKTARDLAVEHNDTRRYQMDVLLSGCPPT